MYRGTYFFFFFFCSLVFIQYDNQNSAGIRAVLNNRFWDFRVCARRISGFIQFATSGQILNTRRTHRHSKVAFLTNKRKRDGEKGKRRRRRRRKKACIHDTDNRFRGWRLGEWKEGVGRKINDNDRWAFKRKTQYVRSAVGVFSPFFFFLFFNWGHHQQFYATHGLVCGCRPIRPFRKQIWSAAAVTVEN